jgi:hypothetical protein
LGARVSFVILNWNGRPYLEECIKSILRQGYKNYEIIVVDNGSKDGSAEFLKKKFPRARFKNLRLIENKENLGYCGGNNVGISAARGEFVVTLNPDVVLDKDFAKEALKPFKDPRVGIVSPKALRTGTNVIDSAGSTGFNNFFATARGAGEKDEGQYNAEEEVFGAIGAYAVYRRKMLEDIKLNGTEYFDNDFFTYFDEHDLQMRARLFGWKAFYEPRAIARHFWRYSVKKDLVKARNLYEKAFRNYYLSLAKNASAVQVLKALPSLLLLELGVARLSVMYRSPIVFSSKISALKLLERMLEKRRIVQGRKRVSNSEFAEGIGGALDFLRFLLGVEASERDGVKLASIH